MLDYIALIMLIFVGLTLFYGIIALHDIPYDIAVARQHSHAAAVPIEHGCGVADMRARGDAIALGRIDHLLNRRVHRRRAGAFRAKREPADLPRYVGRGPSPVAWGTAS